MVVFHSFFLWLSNILLYIYYSIYYYIYYTYYYIVHNIYIIYIMEYIYITSSLSIHLLMGHLGCFNVLAFFFFFLKNEREGAGHGCSVPRIHFGHPAAPARCRAVASTIAPSTSRQFEMKLLSFLEGNLPSRSSRKCSRRWKSGWRQATNGRT